MLNRLLLVAAFAILIAYRLSPAASQSVPFGGGKGDAVFQYDTTTGTVYAIAFATVTSTPTNTPTHTNTPTVTPTATPVPPTPTPT